MLFIYLCLCYLCDVIKLDFDMIKEQKTNYLGKSWLAF